MIANYGYRDAEGEFYITIDTDFCARCEGNPCVAACPEAVFFVEEDPYGDIAVAVEEGKRRRLAQVCAACKGKGGGELPCVASCPHGAMTHSW